MKKGLAYVLVPITLGLGGCGTYVPPLSENRYSQAASLAMVQAIVRSVHCEIVRSVRYVMGPLTFQDAEQYRNPVTEEDAAFMDDWGAQVLLTLQVDELTSLSPNALWSIAGAVTSTLGFGGTVTPHSTRIEKLNLFYQVSDLRSEPPCTPVSSPDSPLIQSDLHLAEWLQSEAIVVGTLEAKPPPAGALLNSSAGNVVQHEVKFDLITSGNITPGWKLQNLNINQTGNFLAASRERVHDLLITFGPLAPSKTALATTAESAHLASQINLRLNSTTIQ
jgi:hypothetical protein